MTCPALSVLIGTMGRDEHGRTILPQHRFTDPDGVWAGRCAHCGVTP